MQTSGKKEDLADPASLTVDRPDAPALDRTAQALIGRHLKTMYREIAEEPVPSRFLELLDELERREERS
jgi:hypothetical protein